MKCKLDENLGDIGRDILVAAGHDVATVAMQGLSIAILDCRGRLSPRTILARVRELAALLETESVDGQLWIVEPGRVRVHERRDPP